MLDKFRCGVLLLSEIEERMVMPCEVNVIDMGNTTYYGLYVKLIVPLYYEDISVDRKFLSILEISEIDMKAGRFINYSANCFENNIEVSCFPGELCRLFDKSIDWIATNVKSKWNFRIYVNDTTPLFSILFGFEDNAISVLFKLTRDDQ